MDKNNIKTPKELWLLLAVREHCINISIKKILQSSESTMEESITVVIISFRLPTTVFNVSDTK